MARRTSVYVCQECGASHPKWAGRCEACGAWNALVEEAAPERAPRGPSRGRRARMAFEGLAGEGPHPERQVSNIAEFDRVAGGGLVAGSVLLVGGDPGIGKSTLMMQVAAALAKDLRTAYVSGEEAVEQLRLRARRLGLAAAPLELAAATDVADVVAALDATDGPRAVVIDSIQTMFVDGLDSAPGTVAQVRAAAQLLIRFAKRRGAIVFLVGHVTKEGLIAGPRVLEHMVDTVLYFEGERSHQFRILRAVKNRFGPADEIGVFEMTGAGLVQVPNPSALFLADRQGNVSGSCVFAGMEGSRPVLVEIQSLIAPSALATPRRAVVGWDSARLAMMLAVLEARGRLPLGGADVYLNVAGGLRISEPAADLAVAAALASAVSGQPMPAETVVFGEVGLSGEVRPVAQAELRLKEAAKLGFARALVPPLRAAGRPAAQALPPGLAVEVIGHVRELLVLFPERPRRKAAAEPWEAAPHA